MSLPDSSTRVTPLLIKGEEWKHCCKCGKRRLYSKSYFDQLVKRRQIIKCPFCRHSVRLARVDLPALGNRRALKSALGVDLTIM
jgi:hypothetical protein